MPEFRSKCGEGAELSHNGHTIGDAHSHHEKAGRVLAKKDPRPLQAFEVCLGDGLPCLLRKCRDFLNDVQAIFLRFDLFELIHHTSLPLDLYLPRKGRLRTKMPPPSYPAENPCHQPHKEAGTSRERLRAHHSICTLSSLFTR